MAFHGLMLDAWRPSRSAFGAHRGQVTGACSRVVHSFRMFPYFKNVSLFQPSWWSILQDLGNLLESMGSWCYKSDSSDQKMILLRITGYLIKKLGVEKKQRRGGWKSLFVVINNLVFIIIIIIIIYLMIIRIHIPWPLTVIIIRWELSGARRKLQRCNALRWKQIRRRENKRTTHV